MYVTLAMTTSLERSGPFINHQILPVHPRLLVVLESAMGEEKEVPPPGCRPIWIQMKNYDLYQLREEGAEAGNMTALKQYTLLDRARLLEEVGKFGFMCDWNDFKADLEACPTEQILLVADPNKMYGEQWYFTFTAEAFETQLKLQTAEAEAEKARLEAEAEAARLAEEEANRKPVYEDKPIIAKGWKSETAADTAREVESLTIRPERPLVVMSMTRPRRSFGLPCKLVDRDAYDWLTDDYMAKMGIRKYLATGFTAFDPTNPDRKLMDSPCQAAAESAPASSQTTWFRSVNASVQYSTMHLEQQEDAFNGIGEDDAPLTKTNENEDELKELRTFTDLVHSKNKVMSAIDWLPKRNGCVAVSAVKNVNFEERVQLSGQARGAQNIASYELKKPMYPTGFTKLHVQNCPIHSFVASFQVDNAYVLLWDFADLIHPMLKLESPHEIFCFRFNPSIPGLLSLPTPTRIGTQTVVGGAINGQVVMWDISKALTSIDQKKRKQSVRHIGKPGLGVGDEDEVVAALPPIAPHAVSHIDMSHRRLVADLAWLPTTTQVNSKGQLLGSEYITEHTHQFITVASDGQCLIWDTRYQLLVAMLPTLLDAHCSNSSWHRYSHGRCHSSLSTPENRQEISEGLFPHIAKPRQTYDKKREEHGRPPPAPWTPLFRLQLNRLEDVGELGLCRIVLDLGVAGDGVTSDSKAEDGAEEVDMRSQGEILLADWRARVGANSGRGGGDEEAGGGGNERGDGGDVAPEFVKWVSSDHTRPCVALDKSPFFPGVLLSVGDWSFQIWKVGLRKPVFSSPMAANYLTTGRWSPTRPGMLFLGKVDGSMDVWDFTDSSFTPSVTLMSSPSRITSMEFLKPKGVGGAAKLKQQLLTVGDAAGNLHVYDVPQNLWRPLANERAIMSYFLEREIKVFTANLSIKAKENDLFNEKPVISRCVDCFYSLWLAAPLQRQSFSVAHQTRAEAHAMDTLVFYFSNHLLPCPTRYIQPAMKPRGKARLSQYRRPTQPTSFKPTSITLEPNATLSFFSCSVSVHTLTKRVEHVSERLEIRTAEAEAMEAEEMQNALNQPPDGAAGAAAAEEGGAGEPAGGGDGGGAAGNAITKGGQRC
ncbi:unnamed protein product [Ectocarpus sp. CCAP 1310/34]|nr:unnamed protein product [Ectocarpus sp. CCAP 1310/34]